MKNIVKFLFYIVYTTIIFLLPNKLIYLSFAFNILLVLLLKINMKVILRTLIGLLPFIIFTFVVNVLIDGTIIYSGIVALKLLSVCAITVIYSQTISVLEFAKTIKHICTPLKLFKINIDEIEILISISLSIIPIIKREIKETKEVCRAKNIKINIVNSKIIISKFLLSFLRRVNDLDKALIEKGCDY